jgi:hypothetical protein
MTIKVQLHPIFVKWQEKGGRNCLAGIELRKTEQELLQINVSLINLVYFIRKQDIVIYIKILSQTDSSKLYTGLYTTRAPEKTNMCRRQ